MWCGFLCVRSLFVQSLLHPWMDISEMSGDDGLDCCVVAFSILHCEALRGCHSFVSPLLQARKLIRFDADGTKVEFDWKFVKMFCSCFLSSPDEHSMILFLLVWFLAAETLVFRGIRAVVVGHFSTADLLGHRWSALQPLGLHQAGCFTLSQSQQPATLNVVAANSGTERYESSLVRLLTEDTLSPLCSSSVLFASLCISSLPPQLCFGVGRPLFFFSTWSSSWTEDTVFAFLFRQNKKSVFVFNISDVLLIVQLFFLWLPLSSFFYFVFCSLLFFCMFLLLLLAVLWRLVGVDWVHISATFPFYHKPWWPLLLSISVSLHIRRHSITEN